MMISLCLKSVCVFFSAIKESHLSLHIWKWNQGFRDSNSKTQISIRGPACSRKKPVRSAILDQANPFQQQHTPQSNKKCISTHISTNFVKKKTPLNLLVSLKFVLFKSLGGPGAFCRNWINLVIFVHVCSLDI